MRTRFKTFFVQSNASLAEQKAINGICLQKSRAGLKENVLKAETLIFKAFVRLP
jgi:hypothetical protein